MGISCVRSESECVLEQTKYFVGRYRNTKIPWSPKLPQGGKLEQQDGTDFRKPGSL